MLLEEYTILPESQRRALGILLADEGLGIGCGVELLRGDGSDRGFLRISSARKSFIAVIPSPTQPRALAEARAAWEIGRHLELRGVPVPGLFGFEPHTGLILCEDLGDVQLHGLLCGGRLADAEVVTLYRRGVELLLHMQLEGLVGFDPGWCWDTPSYDRELMLDRESGYFWEACCRDYLGLTAMVPGLVDDFQHLADLAGAQPAGYFLHRDFQARNLLSKEGRLRVLDFQGGRLGPLGYDLASFLNDPYVNLPLTSREELFDYYLQLLEERCPELVAGCREGYLWLALQRNLQILGAFAFLSRAKGKSFFQAYLRPAALNLDRLLREPRGARLPALRALAAELPERFEKSKIT